MPALFRLPALLLAAALAVPAPSPAAVWFEVAEIETHRNQSFLLALEDPVAIAAARRFLAEGAASGVGSIVVARIEAGGDGFNRDLRAPRELLWSWRVVDFEGFAENAIELCDGWPGWIEEDPAAFIANTNGMICFWGYRLSRELAQAPEFRVTEGLDGAWLDPETPGQGLYLDVLSATGQLALGWYTYAEGAPAAPGDAGLTWYTAQGSRQGARAALTLYRSRDGLFNQSQPVVTEAVGSAELAFSDCDHARLRFAFDSGASGEIPLRRVVPRPGCVLADRAAALPELR